MKPFVDNADVHLKDEGDFGSIFFSTPKAREWAKKQNVPSDYTEIFPDSYRHDCSKRKALNLARQAERDGLQVESEF